MDSPLISIIVPVYNVEKYLSQCLDSLINQTMKEIEIICMNDGSKDRSLEILKEYAAKDGRVIVLDQQNSGVSIARNNALKHVTGEYYMFVDSDDWLDLDTCDAAYNYAEQNNADCLMISYTKEFADRSIVNHIYDKDFLVWNKDEVMSNFHRRLFGPMGEELTRPQDLDLAVSVWGQLFKTSKFKDIPFVDIREIGSFEDGLYQMIVYKDCGRFVYIDKPYYHYRKANEGSITTTYKAYLYEKWQHLYDLIQGYIVELKLGKDYNEALYNRIALGIIGLGLNQVHSDDNIFQGGCHLRQLLTSERYEKALSQLDTSVMPFPWKVFFSLAKHKMSTSLFAMLKMIEYLRVHKK